MKRVRCPKCDQYILFDETKYTEGQSLVLYVTGVENSLEYVWEFPNYDDFNVMRIPKKR